MTGEAETDISIRIITDHLRSMTFRSAILFCRVTKAENMYCAVSSDVQRVTAGSWASKDRSWRNFPKR